MRLPGSRPLPANSRPSTGFRDQKSLEAAIAKLQQQGAGVLFRFSSGQDIKDSTRMIAQASQGGLGMPDRDYYFRDDEKSKQLRADYEQHVAKMFALAGDAPDQAAAEAKTVETIETALAKASRTRVELRDPEKNYHLMPLADMQTLTPDWPWETYLQEVGSPAVEQVNIRQPEFFKVINEQLTSVALPDWKVYLRWHVIHANAPDLPERFVSENFDFYDRKLTGTKEILPRWKRCVQSTDRNLGEALGQVYVDKYFPPAAKSPREGNGEQPGGGAPRGYSHAFLDGAGNEKGSPGKTRSIHGENRVSRQMAGLCETRRSIAHPMPATCGAAWNLNLRGSWRKSASPWTARNGR